MSSRENGAPGHRCNRSGVRHCVGVVTGDCMQCNGAWWLSYQHNQYIFKLIIIKLLILRNS